MFRNTEELAKKIRLHTLDMTHLGGSSHIGSILSIVDIVAVLYGRVLRFDSSNPKLVTRDRFILSKGHAGACVYAALAETGFFPVDALKEHYSNGSIFSGHVSHKGIPGVELSTGSLGHGLSVGVGMALSAKLDNRQNRVFVLMSDGECDEGSNWEAIMFAAHHKLDNLVVIVDYNKLQSLKSIINTLSLEPFIDKWEAFGWNVREVDGHHHGDLSEALESGPIENKPTCFIANTVKGKGVSFMENSVLWHYRSPQGQEYIDARNELLSGESL